MNIIPGRTFLIQGMTIRTGDIPLFVLTILSITSYLILTLVTDPDVIFFVLIGLTIFFLWLSIKFEYIIGIR